MKIRSGVAALCLAAAISLLGAAASSAATQVGNACKAEVGFAAGTALQLTEASANPLPLAVPSAGVITSWRVDAVAAGAETEEKLKVFRPSSSSSFQVVAESDPQSIGGVENVANTRIPVQAGDRIGVHGMPDFLFCEGGPGDVMAANDEDSPIGSTPLFAEILEARLDALATVEPDADGDGYGDETQDGCPQSAAYQGPCPVVELHARTKRKRKRLWIVVRASMEAEVTVYGQAMWGFKPKNRKLGKRNLIVPLYGGTKTVAPGKPTRFPIRDSKEVKRRLRRLTPKESIRTRITVTAPNIAGDPTTTILKPRLHGWKQRG